MAALLRHGAARKLGGSMVQRAQAAVAEERRRLGPRLMHTDELGGSVVQRAQAAVLEEQRRLGPRLKHTDELGGSVVQRAQAAVLEERPRLGPRLKHTDESVRKEVMLKIQQKKEELYDAISNAEKEHRITDWWNRMLAHDLSVHVTPRPFDSNWRRLRIANRMNSMLDTSGLVSLYSILALMIYLRVLGTEDQEAQPVLTSKASGDNI